MNDRLPAWTIWALGATQIIGYGTLYYSFSVLAPDIGKAFGWSPEWVFGALTVALLAGGFSSPISGYLVDRFGAVRIMTIGSIIAAVMLLLMSLAPNGFAFSAALVGMEVSSTLVLYATAFAAIVQKGGRTAQRSITHLTLIAGFASTLFWPLTAWLLTWMDWRSVYLVFAALNLLVCAPLHFGLRRVRVIEPEMADNRATTAEPGSLPHRWRGFGLGLMLLGFASEGFVLSAILLQIVPLLTALSMGEGMLLVTTMFGPAQVLSRLVNMVAGKGLSATMLAVIAAAFLPLGTLILAFTAPSLPGAVLFAVVFGLGSGLTSITAGTLPLQLLGRERYGTRLGWLSAARQVASAVAPFLMAASMASLGAMPSVWIAVALGALAVGVFAVLAGLETDGRKMRLAAGAV